MKVAVYGTLKHGHGNHACLEGAHFVGTDYIRGQLYDLGPYPAAKRSADPNTLISVEVYEINDTILKRLDRLEGVPVLYTRESVFTERKGDRVFAYFFARNIPDRMKIGTTWPAK